MTKEMKLQVINGKIQTAERIAYEQELNLKILTATNAPDAQLKATQANIDNQLKSIEVLTNEKALVEAE